MEHDNMTNLDIKTLIHLLTVDGIPNGTIMRLIAAQCGIPEDKFIQSVTASPEVDKGRKYVRWTPERMTDLVDRWNSGDRPGDIARDYGCATQVIYQRINFARKQGVAVQKRRPISAS